jgi:hypothetical protein
MRYLDQELKAEYYQILKDNGEDLPSAVPTMKTTPAIQAKHDETVRENMEHAAKVRAEFAEANNEYTEEERRLEIAEERLEQATREDYERREAGKKSSVIPAAIQQPSASGYNSGGSQGKNFIAGAVSGTDSESESEFISHLRGGRKKVAFKWTP